MCNRHARYKHAYLIPSSISFPGRSPTAYEVNTKEINITQRKWQSSTLRGAGKISESDDNNLRSDGTLWRAIMVLIRGDHVEITRKRSARTRQRRRGFWCRKVLSVSRSRRQAGSAREITWAVCCRWCRASRRPDSVQINAETSVALNSHAGKSHNNVFL